MKVFERTLNPLYTGSVNLGVNHFTVKFADEYFTYRLMNKHRERCEEL